jgi:hypothetical protein
MGEGRERRQQDHPWPQLSRPQEMPETTAFVDGGSTTARAVIGVVVALSATGPLEVRGVMATTIAATASTAIVPPPSATTFMRDRRPESSTSRRVGPSSDGCRHDRS